MIMNKKVLLLLLPFFWTITGLSQVQHISVKGKDFVLPDGTPIVFHGIDTSEPDKVVRDGHWNEEYFKTIKDWGANAVRFAVHPVGWHMHGKTNYLKLLDSGVAMAQKQGLYVIIDWHCIGNLYAEKFFLTGGGLYPTNLYDTTKVETLDFWRTMATHYRGNNTVAFFELFNEPALGGNLGQATWTQWKQLMEQLIAGIRNAGGTAIPLVAGFNYAYDLKPVALEPINAEGIGYVSHPYPMKARQPWINNWTRDWGFVAEKYPVMLTEIAFQGPEEPGGYNPIIGDETYGDAITTYCARRGISYMVWCFDPDWPPSLIKDWKFTPSRQGAYFKKAMLQK